MCMTAYHPLDTLLAWLEGIFVGMADVATTLDWKNCKLPVVAETMKRIGQCACGDKAYSIPEETKSRVDTQFWYAHRRRTGADAPEADQCWKAYAASARDGSVRAVSPDPSSLGRA